MTGKPEVTREIVTLQQAPLCSISTRASNNFWQVVESPSLI
jgi:hypothetical protein